MSTTQVLRYQGKVVSGYLINDNGEVFSTQGNKRIPVSYFLKNGTYFFKIIIKNSVLDIQGMDLVLSNFVEKPTNFKSVARFKQININDKLPLRVENMRWVRLDGEIKTADKRQNVSKNDLKTMHNVFVSGVMTSLYINEQGVIFDHNGKEVKTNISRLGKPCISINMPFDMGSRTVNIVDIMAETFHLPQNHLLINYYISYLDKNKKNCSKNNIILWPEGHSGVACKKMVKVLKDGKFFGVFDSVQRCSEIIAIPRRRVSELLKNGTNKNGFSVSRFAIF